MLFNTSKNLITHSIKDAEVLIIIDGHNLAWRTHTAKGFPSTFKNSSGYPTGHIYLTITKLWALIKAYSLRNDKKFCLVYSFDEYSDNRRKYFKKYKEGRNKEFETVVLVDPLGTESSKEVNHIEDVKGLLSLLPHTDLSIPTKDAETDDIIATFVKKINKKYPKKKIYILTTDKDMWALTNDNVTVTRKPKEEITKDIIKEKFGTKNPKKVCLAKSLLGDESDKIPKIPKATVKSVGSLIRKCKKEKGENWFDAFYRYMETQDISKELKSNLLSHKKKHRVYYNKIFKLKTKLSIKSSSYKGNIDDAMLLLNHYGMGIKTKNIVKEIFSC